MPHRLRELWPILLAIHPVFGWSEWLGLVFSGLAFHFAAVAASSPNPLDWNGMAAFLLALAAVLGAFGTMAASLVKTWVTVTENRAKIEGMETAAVSAKAEAEAKIAQAKAEADLKIAGAKAEADARHDAILAQNAEQQRQIDKYVKEISDIRHGTREQIDGIKWTMAADKARTPDPDATVNVHVINDKTDPVPVIVPLVVVTPTESPRA